MTNDVSKEVDWQHYAKHKSVIDEKAKELLASGLLQGLGYPPGPLTDVHARALCAIAHKHPERVTGDSKKPLTNSEKRRLKRAEEGKGKFVPPDEEKTIVEDYAEGEYKIIQNEDWTEPKHARYLTKGNVAPEGWQPISLQEVKESKEIAAH